MSVQLEYEFALPVGYVDEMKVVHKEGAMRLATVKDEITPLQDPRVRANEAYLILILLSQVITRLGTMNRITPNTIENMFAVDLAYLQELYRRINDIEMSGVSVVCPYCGQEFEEKVLL